MPMILSDKEEAWVHSIVLLCRLLLIVMLSSEIKQKLLVSTPILLATIAPSLHDPEVPGGKANWLWRRMISLALLGQSKALPSHIVLPGPVMSHVYVSTSPGQAQLALSGISRASVSVEIKEQSFKLLIQNFSNCVKNYSVTGLTMHAHSHSHKNYS